MSGPTETVVDAIEDVSVNGRVCLEAGAGVGNMTAALTQAGAARVYAVSNERSHVEAARDRVGGDRVAALEADLTAIPLPDDAVDVVTAHCLFNVVTPHEATRILAELTRVARPGAWLVVDDYAPLPDSPVRDLFGVENAAGELASGDPVYTYYSAEWVRRVAAGFGWEAARTRTLLDPVPWPPALLEEHRAVVDDVTADLPPSLRAELRAAADRARERAGDGVDAGRLYSVALRR